MKKLTLSLLLAALLGGCASTETAKDQPRAAVEDRTGGQGAPGDTGTVTPLPPPTSSANPLTDPNNILSKRSVFFDYDSDAIKPEYKGLIEAHAKYLMANKSAKAFIQGNTDERGSREYNLALGQRRADSVRKMMSVLGASDAQLEAVSFGEEKPRATCADESCWSQNRRADIVYQGE
jgi:peptidoglycan-associated lipoprotein